MPVTPRSAPELSGALTQAAKKINWFAQVRAYQRQHQLSDPASDNWQGTLRNSFEREFYSQQNALAELAARMLQLSSKVANATYPGTPPA